MEEIILIIIEFAAELLIQLASEGLIDLGSWAGGKKRPMHPVAAFFWYSLLSLGTAGISLQLFPHHFIRNPEFRVWNLILSPIVSAVVMGEWGGYLRKKQILTSRLDTYMLGFFFALIFAAVRYRYAG